jgi:hypothetical protein
MLRAINLDIEIIIASGMNELEEAQMVGSLSRRGADLSLGVTADWVPEGVGGEPHHFIHKRDVSSTHL